MAASFNDMAILGASTNFQARVQAALVSGSVAIAAEAATIAMHYQRLRFAAQVLSGPSSFAPQFAQSVATDSNVIGDATQGGTVSLTTANIATQQALITDSHILGALGSQLNAYFPPM